MSREQLSVPLKWAAKISPVPLQLAGEHSQQPPPGAVRNQKASALGPVSHACIRSWRLSCWERGLVFANFMMSPLEEWEAIFPWIIIYHEGQSVLKNNVLDRRPAKQPKELSSSLRRETSYWFAHCYRGQFLIIIRPLWKVKAFKSCEGFHHCNLASICSMATQADCFNFSVVFFLWRLNIIYPFKYVSSVFLDMQPHIVFQKSKLKHSTLFWCTIQ